MIIPSLEAMRKTDSDLNLIRKNILAPIIKPIIALVSATWGLLTLQLKKVIQSSPK